MDRRRPGGCARPSLSNFREIAPLSLFCQQAFRFPYSLLPSTLPRGQRARTNIAAMNALTALHGTGRRHRFFPRLEILNEVVAGFLLMQLDLPGDVDREEM